MLLRAVGWLGLVHLMFSFLMADAAPLIVMLDPGHGGRDRGAIHNEVQEADVTLAVALELRRLLKADPRFNVRMTRDADITVPLSQRPHLAKNEQADLFVSIHVNSSPDAKARGAEFYFQNQLPPDEESMFLAHQEDVAENSVNSTPTTYAFLDRHPYPTEITAILNDLLDTARIQRSSELSKALKLSWHGTRKTKNNSVRQAPFHVLSQMRMPSSLVELGFLTNSSDYAELTNPQTLKRMAQDLLHGLIAYKESIDKDNQSP